ncbi:hypothetical protein [Cereibacter sphaeroides]|uniref:hypothetical protein n=1 Tax=Cereibacter sphaeroides TaxID=1063 RepID=UPI001F2DF659|nr:hypothetical protein [Cereibacter sphaeroides]
MSGCGARAAHVVYPAHVTHVIHVLYLARPTRSRVVPRHVRLWDHPRHGALQPGIFIPLAERLGHIHAMGN